MTMNGSVLLRILAFVCFVLFVILVLISATGGKFEEILVPSGLGLWVLSTLVP